MSGQVNFNRKLFVNRDKEKNLFVETIQASTEMEYLEFTGVTGQGKTELLKWIFYKAKDENCLSAYLDFESKRYYYPELIPLLERIVSHLAKDHNTLFRLFKDNLVEYRKKLKSYYNEPRDNQDDELSDVDKFRDILLESFMADFIDVLNSCKVVLCIDSTEKADKKLLELFEDAIVSKCLSYSKFMLVIAGQEPYVWRDKRLKQKIGDRRFVLEPFDDSAIAEQVKSLAREKGIDFKDVNELGNTMFDITLGHPFSNIKLVDFWLRSIEKQKTLTHEIAQEQLSASIQYLVYKFIKKRILKKVKLPHDYPPSIEILRYLSPLRRIEFSMLWYILSAFLKEHFDGKPFPYFEQLLKSFQDENVLSWRSDKGYQLESIVRNILLFDLRYNYTEEYMSLQEAVAKQYDVYVKQTKDHTRNNYIVEGLYHRSAYLFEKHKEPSVTFQDIREQLKNYLLDYFNPEPSRSELETQMLLDLSQKIKQESERDDSMKKYGIDVNILYADIDVYKESGKKIEAVE